MYKRQVIASLVLSIFSAVSICTDMVERYGEPKSDICAVERGTYMRLSGLLNPLDHFDFVTPMTVKSTLSMRMVLPRGSSLAKRFSTTVGHMTATLSLFVLLFSVINVPSVTVVLFTVPYVGRTP